MAQVRTSLSTQAAPAAAVFSVETNMQEIFIPYVEIWYAGSPAHIPLHRVSDLTAQSLLLVPPLLSCGLGLERGVGWRCALSLLRGLGLVVSISQLSPRQTVLQRNGLLTATVASMWLWGAMLALLVTLLVQGSLDPPPGSYRWLWTGLSP